jgi:hypothetical protein
VMGEQTGLFGIKLKKLIDKLRLKQEKSVNWIMKMLYEIITHLNCSNKNKIVEK